ncbi:MAG: hypothetical protein Q8K92_23210 [Leadbetterella sp.]|nr:hypothetical protein [Leadbetterella sp.]
MAETLKSTMNRSLTFIFLIIFGHYSNGQTKNMSIPTNENGEISFWFKYQQDNFQKANLENLQTNFDSLHFRLSTQHQAIDIWTNDNEVFYGSLTSFTTEYDQEKHKKDNPKPDKFYSMKSSIDPLTAKKIYELINKQSIFNIPSGEKINGWNLGSDGEEFIIEHSTKTNYSFKEYWTPSFHRNKLKEAMVIDNLTKEISIILQMGQSFKKFIDSLPYGCYHSGSMVIICRTKNKRRK